MEYNSNIISSKLSDSRIMQHHPRLSCAHFVMSITESDRKIIRKKSKRLSFSIRDNLENTLKKSLRHESGEVITYQTVINFLRIPRYDRKLSMIKTISNFLVSHYEFFRNLYEKNREKVHSIVSVLDIDVYNQHDTIIRCGEEGTKFFMILKGKVGIYKPKLIQMTMTMKKFVKKLIMIKCVEKDECKLKRIEDANQDQHDIEQIKEFGYDYKKYSFDKRKKVFFEEMEDLIDEAGEGSSFGEVALIQKTTRNATIRAKDDQCYIASITKSDYNKIIKHIETKAFYDKIEDFRNYFCMLKNWTKQSIIRLMNAFAKESLTKGEYIYHQGDKGNYVYFILDGTFDIYIDVTLESLDNYIKYISSSKQSIISSIHQKKDIVSAGGIEAFLHNRLLQADDYPVDLDSNYNYYLDSMPEKSEDDLINIKLKEQMIIKNPKRLFRFKIKSTSQYEIFGFEEAFEIKRRFASIVCTSTAEVRKVKIYDLVNLLINKDNELNDIQKFISEKKEIFLERVNNLVKIEMNSISQKLKAEYDKIIIEKHYPLSEPNETALKHSVKFRGKYIKPNINIKLYNKSRLKTVKKKTIKPSNDKSNHEKADEHMKRRGLSEDYADNRKKLVSSYRPSSKYNQLIKQTSMNNIDIELFKIPGIYTTSRGTRPQSNYTLRNKSLSLLSMTKTNISKCPSFFSLSNYIMNTTNSNCDTCQSQNSKTFLIHNDQIPTIVKMKYYSAKPKYQLKKKQQKHNSHNKQGISSYCI